MEQLQQPQVGVELDQRRHGRVGEGGVGLAAHVQERVGGEGVAREAADHRGGDLGVRAAGEARDLLARQLRPRLRRVQAAVGGQAREQGLGEGDGRGLAPGGDVAHAGQRFFFMDSSTLEIYTPASARARPNQVTA